MITNEITHLRWRMANPLTISFVTTTIISLRHSQTLLMIYISMKVIRWAGARTSGDGPFELSVFLSLCSPYILYIPLSLSYLSSPLLTCRIVKKKRRRRRGKRRRACTFVWDSHSAPSPFPPPPSPPSNPPRLLRRFLLLPLLINSNARNPLLHFCWGFLPLVLLPLLSLFFFPSPLLP